MSNMFNDKVPLDIAKQKLSYDKETGVFTWLSTARKGMEAGSESEFGYTRIQVANRWVFAHRLAWAFYYGEYPDHFVIHKNNDRRDNRIINLSKST